jgi:phytoene synthase
VHALYGFVRVPDEWVDNARNMSVVRRHKILNDYRSQLIRGLDGVSPSHPALRAFCDVMHVSGFGLEEPLLFLDAMVQDLSIGRYATYEDLRGYMRGSAGSVGVMMCAILQAERSETVTASAVALGEAMQLTNFIRDVAEDARRGRIYLPLQDLDRFGVTQEDVLTGNCTEQFRALLAFEVARARQLYAIADPAIAILPRRSRKAVKVARILYSRILDRVERMNYDVFRGRARTSKLEKLRVLIQVLSG